MTAEKIGGRLSGVASATLLTRYPANLLDLFVF